MDKIKLLFILCVGIIAIQLTNAAPPFQTSTGTDGYTIETPVIPTIKQNTDHDFHTHVFNTSNGIPIISPEASCVLHLYNSEGHHQYNESMNFETATQMEFALDINGANFSTVGEYAVLLFCNSSVRGGFIEYGIMVTPTGTDFIEAEGTIYSVFSLILFLILSVLIYSAIRVPWRNSKTDDLSGMFYLANNLRVYKIGLVALSYLVTMWLFGLLHNISVNYLILTGIANFFKWVYLILLSLAFPVLIVAIILGIIAVIRAAKLEKLHKQSMEM